MFSEKQADEVLLLKVDLNNIDCWLWLSHRGVLCCSCYKSQIQYDSFHIGHIVLVITLMYTFLQFMAATYLQITVAVCQINFVAYLKLLCVTCYLLTCAINVFVLSCDQRFFVCALGPAEL